MFKAVAIYVLLILAVSGLVVRYAHDKRQSAQRICPICECRRPYDRCHDFCTTSKSDPNWAACICEHRCEVHPTAHKAVGESHDLFKFYLDKNQTYFGGKLPTTGVTVEYDQTVEDRGDAGASWITEYEGEGVRVHIGIAPLLKRMPVFEDM